MKKCKKCGGTGYRGAFYSIKRNGEQFWKAETLRCECTLGEEDLKDEDIRRVQAKETATGPF